MTETEHAQWIRQFWKDKLDEIKGADRMSNEYLDIAMEKVIKQEINAVLEQIRDEISAILTNSYDEGVKEKALQIIDKYKTESEEGKNG